MPTELAKKRILTQLVALPRLSLQTLKNGSAPTGFCALVVDDDTLPVLSGATKTYDLLENGISVIQLITKTRQPLPELDCIYFLTPKKESVEQLIQDFRSEKKPTYRSVHIFWSTTITQELMEMIGSSTPLLSRIKSFVDFNLHFRAFESRVFHLDLPLALRQLLTFHGNGHDESLLRLIASRLATVCITMGEFPSIRFLNDGHHSSLNRQIAQYVQEYFDSIKAQGVIRSKSELIIIDRSIDVCAMLIHEYTYQALAYDVLEIPICIPPGQKLLSNGEQRLEDVYTYIDPKKGQKVFLLSESDELYVRYRHKHIASVITGVNEELKKFSKDNAAAQYKGGGGGERGGGGGGGGPGGGATGGVDVAQAIRALPQYTEMIEKFMNHINMSESCFSTLNQTGIFRAGVLEQDLATGVDKHGKSVQVLKILEELAKLVSDKSGVIMTEKVRLLLLYFSMMDGVQPEDKKKMIRAAGMSLEIEKIIDTFGSLDLSNSGVGGGGMGGAGGGDSSSSLKHVHKIHKNEDLLAYYKKRAKSAQYELSRFEPVIKEMFESAAAKRLSRSKYPYLQDPDFGGYATTQHNAHGGGRIRATQLDWDYESSDISPTDDQNLANLAKSTANSDKPKVIIFCVGGITFSEIRSAYEVNRSTNAEIFIGGTSILTTPGLFGILKSDIPNQSNGNISQ